MSPSMKNRAGNVLMDEIRFGNIVFIPGLNKGRYPYCNSIYIDDEVKAVIDPASNPDLLLDIKQKSGIDVIINSHYHEDHYAFNYLFPDAELWVPELEAPCFKSMKSLYEYWGADKPSQEEFALYLQSFHYEERIPTREFRDGDILDFGNTKLEVISAPGHTPGHSCFYCEEQKLLITTDYDMAPFGPWYGDKYSDLLQTIQSVRKLLTIPAIVYITSHDMGIIKGSIKEAAESYLHKITERENRVFNFLAKEHTIEEMLHQWLIYKKPIEPQQLYIYAEEKMLRDHLAYLLHKGLIKQAGDKYIAV
jgi:hydroxyacylglutathione hydrolase